MTQTLQWVVRSWTDLENSMVAVERVQDYTHVPKEVKIGRWSEGPWVQGGACPLFPTKQHSCGLESQPGRQ